MDHKAVFPFIKKNNTTITRMNTQEKECKCKRNVKQCKTKQCLKKTKRTLFRQANENKTKKRCAK